MKRSFVNAAIARAIDFADSHGITLPPFAHWSPQVWQTKGPEADEIRDLMLGWDVTDFGLDRFNEVGRTLFTVRNGSYKLPRYTRTYSEKFIFIEEEQAAPIHFHRRKMEDIICRSGGNIIVELHASDPAGGISAESFEMSVNGCIRTFAPGQTCRLTPGESVFIPPGIIHRFWSEKGGGMTISGEIGSICDDIGDNVFLSPCRRFSRIDEDEPARWILCNEYRSK